MSEIKKWVKRSNCKDFNSYVEYCTGKTTKQFAEDQFKEYCCPQIPLIAEELLKIKGEQGFIAGVFDYDADGLCSAAETHLLFNKIGIKHSLTIPKRMSEGYGVSPAMVQRFENATVLFTVDNGISAFDAISEAKNKGMTVIVIDHHNGNGELPDADIIADPEELSKGWSYVHYCGAGLVYKLAQHMFPEDTEFLNQLSCFAGIATIADAVDVTGDNRNIIEKGLENLNKRNGTKGLNALLDLIEEKAGVNPYTVESIAFKLAPVINAPGRLNDLGGEQVLRCFFASETNAMKYAKALYDINEQRKELVKTAMENCTVQGNNISFIYDPTISEGICGIIAGQLSSTYHKPAYVMTKGVNGLVKGSARCEEGYNVFLSLQECAQDLAAFGGHNQAAGFSLKENTITDFLQDLDSCTTKLSEECTEYYDFEIDPADILPLYCEQNKIAIFGEGLKLPVVKLRTTVESPKTIGSTGTTFSCLMGNTKCIGFKMAEKYHELGSPKIMTIYATLNINWYKGRPNSQLQIFDMEL